MNNTRGQIVSAADLPLDTFLPMVVLVGIVVYCLGMAAVILVIYAKYPHRLKQSAAPAVVTTMVSFMDCSSVLQCLPCSDCSFRRALKACCPNTISLRRLISCECARHHMEGRPSGSDMVCCVVRDSS
ncbi:hypothetical protein GCK32_003497 [Trichostrongylus colubriformis]|uniref:Uncharacterized protein n=1 Tax=Trichostrongylus colubriformis TaxID=6319 RepID=A0AAN8IRY6_TRICO